MDHSEDAINDGTVHIQLLRQLCSRTALTRRIFSLYSMHSHTDHAMTQGSACPSRIKIHMLHSDMLFQHSEMLLPI